MAELRVAAVLPVPLPADDCSGGVSSGSSRGDPNRNLRVYWMLECESRVEKDDILVVISVRVSVNSVIDLLFFYLLFKVKNLCIRTLKIKLNPIKMFLWLK